MSGAEGGEISAVAAWDIGGTHVALHCPRSRIGSFSWHFTESSRTERLGVRFQTPPNFSLNGVVAGDPISARSQTVRMLEERSVATRSCVTRRVDSASEERSRIRAALMARVQDGDTESCRTLLDDIGPLLTNFLRRRIGEATTKSPGQTRI
jgi:hypothetical protein